MRHLSVIPGLMRKTLFLSPSGTSLFMHDFSLSKIKSALFLLISGSCSKIRDFCFFDCLSVNCEDFRHYFRTDLELLKIIIIYYC